FRLQDHALAAAERAVVHGAVLIVRKVPQVVDLNLRQAGFLHPADNAIIQRSAKEIGKDRENSDLHRRLKTYFPGRFISLPACCRFSSAVNGAFTSSRPSGRSISIFFPAMSTFCR